MTYRVIFQRLAVQDLDDAFVWAARKAPATAARWLDRFQAALQRSGHESTTLSTGPGTAQGGY